MSGGRVLVVDDGELNRRVLVRALEAEGHTAAQAVDGRAALDMLRDEAVPPPLATQIMLKLLDHPDADPTLPVASITAAR